MSFQTRLGSGHAIAGQDQETARAVDVERVVHRVVRLYLVDESDLHAVATVNSQVMAPFLAPVSRSMSMPDHVAGSDCTVDLRHQVFPLEAVALSWPCARGEAPLLGLGSVVGRSSEGTSFIPHFGHVPGPVEVTSGCIGQT